MNDAVSLISPIFIFYCSQKRPDDGLICRNMQPLLLCLICCVNDFEKIYMQIQWLFVESNCKQGCVYLSPGFRNLADFVSTTNIFKRFKL
jgi:hypothetical protein